MKSHITLWLCFLLISMASVPAAAQDPDDAAGQDLKPTLEADAPAAVEDSALEAKEPAPSFVESLRRKGFMRGLEGFDRFVHPISSPSYFHDPFIDSRMNLLTLRLWLPKDNQLHGGYVDSYGTPFYLALTERLQFMVTYGGYSRVRAGGLRPADGWNDWAFGLKCNLIADRDSQFLLSSGLIWRLSNGHALTLQGGVDELSPFVSAAKGFGKWHVIGTVGGRLAMDRHMGNHMVYESLHVDYELLENFYPLVEFNGLQYLSNADRLPSRVGALDFASIGANDVRGNSVFWTAVGFRWKLRKNVELGASYEFPLTPAENGSLDQRVIVSVNIGF